MKYQIISVQSIYFFAAKGAIYLRATATEVFSHVKITCVIFMFKDINFFAPKPPWYLLVLLVIITINNNYALLFLEYNKFSCLAVT